MTNGTLASGEPFRRRSSIRTGPDASWVTVTSGCRSVTSRGRLNCPFPFLAGPVELRVRSGTGVLSESTGARRQSDGFA